MSHTDRLFYRLIEIVGEAHIIKNPDQLKSYSLDGKRPKAVVFPGTIDEISKVVACACEERLAVIPRGNGTKMAMGGIPKKVDIILSTSRLNRIVDSDCDNLTLSAESGMTLGDVQKRLAKEGKGYFLPLDPPFTDKATLGGIVAANSSGPKRLLYGTARDLITGMKAVFPNGDVVVSGGKTVKNVSGYDMCKLLIGSYGTLGIISEITFKLLPLPEKGATLFIPFAALDECVGFTHDILHSQLLPASMDILNAVAIEKMKYRISMPPTGNYLVAIGSEGVSETIERQISEISEIGKRHGALALETATLHSERHHGFWISVRDFAQGLIMENDTNLISLKSNFLVSKYGEMIRSYEKITQALGFDGALICHSGNGVLYSYVMVGKNVRSKTESLVELVGKLTAEAVKNEGNLVVESSPLSIKKKVDVWGELRSDYQVMCHLKKEIDPRSILNPGRFVGGI